jgi:transglutaminase-like putative cysteine protease
MSNQPNYTLQSIPNGKAGTAATLRIMSRFIKQYKKAPQIRELALKLTRHLRQKDFVAEVEAIHDFVQNRIRYTKDISGVETLQSPVQTLRIGAGDCDDKTMLVAALLESIGHRTRIRAIGFLPNTFCHVLPETRIGGRWFTVETTEPVNVGWVPPGVKSMMVRNT